MIFHVPHSSTDIPTEYLSLFFLDPQELQTELLLMTDHFTDELFLPSVTEHDSFIKFPVSRLLVDPERFPDDEQEEMSKVGMGAIYTRTHNGEPLKNGAIQRDELLKRYFKPHHDALMAEVMNALENTGRALIVDCHSFPKYPLPYELNQEPNRPQVCIGVDPFHTPETLISPLVDVFSANGLTVDINVPFSGAIVPLDFYERDHDVLSVMIEIRRDCYMDESTGFKSDKFTAMQEIISQAISRLR
jgi:N-formylglutamate deformylase